MGSSLIRLISRQRPPVAQLAQGPDGAVAACEASVVALYEGHQGLHLVMDGGRRSQVDGIRLSVGSAALSTQRSTLHILRRALIGRLHAISINPSPPSISLPRWLPCSRFRLR